MAKGQKDKKAKGIRAWDLRAKNKGPRAKGQGPRAKHKGKGHKNLEPRA